MSWFFVGKNYFLYGGDLIFFKKYMFGLVKIDVFSFEVVSFL